MRNPRSQEKQGEWKEDGGRDDSARLVNKRRGVCSAHVWKNQEVEISSKNSNLILLKLV